jgi:iron(III) transport system ATP-binding protein
VLTVSGLRKVFPPQGRRGRATVAVDDVDLVVPVGAFGSVLGPSGSGKTTLLRCIAGFERPDAGVIAVRRRELVSPTTFVRAYARGVGIVPQEGALFPHMTVRQNIGFGLVGRRRRARRDRVEYALDLVGLTGLGERRPHQLSGGQQQRVALARALAPEPDLILLDEPFSALDAQLRVELREEVRELLRRAEATALLVTHDQAEAMSLSDHLIVMREGRVVAAGTPREVYERPVDVELARFLGESLVVPGEIDRDQDGVRVVCPLGRLKVGQWHGSTGPCEVLVRPEQIGLWPAAAIVDPDVARGTVVSQSFLGHAALIRVSVPGIAQEVSARVSTRVRYSTGDLAELRVADTVSTFPKRGSAALS